MPRPPYSGKTLVAELALMRMKRTQPGAKAVYIAPLKVRVAASEREALQ
jgi:replicative superfamily II helicase